MLLGITGTDGAGKGTLVEYLVQKYGFAHYSSRGVILDEIARRGDADTSRANMRIVANEMRKEHGNDFMVTHNLKKIEKDAPEHAIIESIRTTAEAETLKKNGGMLIAVDADQRIRYERVQSRRSETDKVSFEAFVAHEELEINDPDPHGMQKQKVIEMADYTILNNGTTEEFCTEIERLATSLSLHPVHK